MYNIFLIGAGQIGSRHLQSLKSVKFPLDIIVIDPWSESLKLAGQRYTEASGLAHHKIQFLNKMPSNQSVSLAIIATTSDIRSEIIKELVKKNRVRYLILEKILFNKKKDYSDIEKLLVKNKVRTWVNCPIRTMPFYHNLKDRLKNKVLFYVHSGKAVLMGSAIHYVDYMAYLTGSTDLETDTGYLEKVIPSRRKGFLELTGTLILKFRNKGQAIFNFSGTGESPIIIDISDDSNFRAIVKDSENKAWVSSKDSGWKWSEETAQFLMQSQMTNLLAERILKTGQCDLVSYKDSAKLHLQLLEPLRLFLNKQGNKKYNYYPFT